MNPTIFIWASPFGSGSSFQVLVLRRGCFDTPLTCIDIEGEMCYKTHSIVLPNNYPIVGVPIVRLSIYHRGGLNLNRTVLDLSTRIGAERLECPQPAAAAVNKNKEKAIVKSWVFIFTVLRYFFGLRCFQIFVKTV